MGELNPDRLIIGRRIMYDIDRFNLKRSVVQRIFNHPRGESTFRHVTGPFLSVLDLMAFARETGVDVRSYLTPGTMIANQACSNCAATRHAPPPADIRPPTAVVRTRHGEPA